MHKPNESDQIDLKLISIFLGLLETGSQTEVARDNQLTQPAINRSLQKLSGIYQDPLFTYDKKKRRFYPTPKAQALGPELKKVHDIMKGTLSGAMNHTFDYAEAQDTFRIALSAYAFSSLLHRLMDYIYNVSPGIRLDTYLIEPGSGGDVKPVSDRSVGLGLGDVDLILDQELGHYSSLESVPIIIDDWVVIAAETSKLGATLSPEEYFAAKHIVCSLGGYEFAEKAIMEKLHIGLKVPSFSHIVETVSKTSYIAVVPRKVAKAHSKALRLRLYEYPFNSRPIELFAYYDSAAANQEAVKWLIEAILTTSSL